MQRSFMAMCFVLGLCATVAPSTLFASQHSLALVTTSYDWLQFDGNAQHSGNNTWETTITTANVSTLKKAFSAILPGVADGAPVYLAGVATPSGPRDLLYLTTKAGDIVAIDAHSGGQVWRHSYPAGTCTIPSSSTTPCFTTSSPALDPSRQYVYAYALDGFVHKYLATDGTEVTGSGWPELATRKPSNEKGSSDLTIATDSSGVSRLYVTHAGFNGDIGDYQGHVTAINLATGVQHVWNALCSSQTDIHFVLTPGTPDCGQQGGGIWARAGTVYDPDTGKLYLPTGNGTYDPTNAMWGDSVLEVSPDVSSATGVPTDSYTPSNYLQLQTQDADLGSTAPAILPVPAASAIKHLAVQGGKDQNLRLLNLDNLSGQGGPGHVGGEVSGSLNPVPQGGSVLTQPAVWTNPADSTTWVFVANANGISGLQLSVDSAGIPSLNPVWQNGGAGTSPIVANGIVYYAGSGFVQALNPADGTVLWQDTSVGAIHWESPVVANGMLYVADETGTLTAYALPAVTSPSPTATATQPPAPTATATQTVPVSTPTPSPTTTTSVPSPPQNLAATPDAVNGVDLTWVAPSNSGSPPVNGYTIYRGTKSGKETRLTPVGVVLRYTDQATTSGTVYYYKVRAVNTVGQSAYSNEAKSVAR